MPPQWPALCLLIDSLRSGQEALFDSDPELLSVAQRLASRLTSTATPEPAGNGVARVHLDSLEHYRVRSVGAERLTLHALKELGPTATLHALGVSSRQARRTGSTAAGRDRSRFGQPATHPTGSEVLIHPSGTRAAHEHATTIVR